MPEAWNSNLPEADTWLPDESSCTLGLIGLYNPARFSRNKGAGLPLPPPLSEEQRKAALEKAAEARRKRAVLKEELKTGTTSLVELLGRAGDEVVGKMKVSTVLESLPGVGKVREDDCPWSGSFACSRNLCVPGNI